jgi:hypothetical protein
MKMFDRIVAWTMLAFALLHMTVVVVLMSRNLTIGTAWSFAGGLAIIFCVFLNLIRTYRPPDKVIVRISVLANLLLVILSVLLLAASRHDLKANPQVVVFLVLTVLQLLLPTRQWLRYETARPA